MTAPPSSCRVLALRPSSPQRVTNIEASSPWGEPPTEDEEEVATAAKLLAACARGAHGLHAGQAWARDWSHQMTLHKLCISLERLPEVPFVSRALAAARALDSLSISLVRARAPPRAELTIFLTSPEMVRY